ncbi:MAG: Rne/Rng family ribonuclease [Acidobacteriaceae bacterium]
MSKEIYISSTPHETRLAIVEKEQLTEIYYERENEYTLAGSIYKGRVTRVLPGMQSSFVDIGLERDAFLYITDFMEETDEAADFDAASGSEGRGSRGDRSPGAGRGRGRRERGGREATADGGVDGRSGSSEEGEEEARVASGSGQYGESASRGLEEDEAGDGSAASLGAAGGESARRWRGRRGRRRGREAGSEAQHEGSGAEGAGDEFGVEAGPDRPSVDDSAYAPRESGRRDGGRDRGGRDRSGRDRGGRLQRQDAVRERFAPRGPRPAYAGDETVDLQASGQGGAQAEPWILPGESLSKYRRGEPEQAGAAASQAPGSTARPEVSRTVAKPSTEVEPLLGWDGGLVLPGESLSRLREGRDPRGGERGSSPAGAEQSAADATAQDRSQGREQGGSGDSGGRGQDRRRARDQRRGRNGQRGPGDQDWQGSEGKHAATHREYRAEPRGMDPAEAVLPSVESGHDVAESEYEPSAAVHTAREGQEPDAAEPVEFEEAVSEFYDADLNASEDLLPELEFHETTSEYEPEENASVSFRVDPAGAREFRYSGGIADTEEIASSASEEEAAAIAPGDLPSGEEPQTGSEPVVLEPVALGEDVSEEAAGEARPEEESARIPAVSPLPPAPAADAAESSALALDRNFAPGDGQLEEELLDEEELELSSLQADAMDEEMEEESIESAADLGSILRDMTIDDITRSESKEMDEDEDDDVFDEEEDFEEDELESTGDGEGEEGVSGSEISEVEEEEFAEASSYDEDGAAERSVPGETNSLQGESLPEAGDGVAESGRERGRHGHRDSRRGRDRSGRDRRGMPRMGGRERGRSSMQATNLPAISDLLKPGQEVLVQIAKEPIAKKGARITSHIALPGRFLVFMPTVNHTGVSRKIESDAERRRLKEILLSEKGDASGGFIVRTAAAGASEEELRSDLRFLLNLWADIKSRSESSKSPALIYHDLNLIERILRDQVTDSFSAIWVDTEAEYERVLRFLQRFQPSLIRRVKLYTKDTPLFEQFGITEEINAALRSKVWLKSGGSIVINQTEALVAIDINTGKYVGKTARLEDTIVKTNLDAIPEIVRQIRLRDLGGIIIIDFIDMDERKNRNRVMAALEEELKQDRAPSKVLQFNDFGLVAITRKRVKQSLERTLSTTCSVCAGTGMVKSPVTICNDIYIEMRKMYKQIDKGDIMLRVNPETVKQLKSNGGKWLQEMEEMSGKTILVKSDPSLHPEQFDIH